jgi:hypothetical protein
MLGEVDEVILRHRDAAIEANRGDDADRRPVQLFLNAVPDLSPAP